jgi:hypothetical protein
MGESADDEYRGADGLALEIEASGALALRCGRCGERVELLGCEDDWLDREGRTFPCAGCGRGLALGARVVPPVAEDVSGGRG